MRVNIDEIKKHVIEYLTPIYGDKIVSIYGIGTSFVDEMKNSSDIDIIVLLTDTDSCPKKDWTHALFEDHTVNTIIFTFLYGTLDDYLDKERFEHISFSDYAWSVRSLKHGSKLLFGKDIRDQLPDPKYDYKSIWIRSAYHLNGKGTRYPKQMQFTKGIFKFGFYLTAVYYPEANAFNKKSIYDLLKKAVSDGNVSDKIVEYYDLAFKYRDGVEIEKFQEVRLAFIRYWMQETMRSINEEWSEVRNILIQGFGKGGFTFLVSYLDSIAEEIGLIKNSL